MDLEGIVLSEISQIRTTVRFHLDVESHMTNSEKQRQSGVYQGLGGEGKGKYGSQTPR